MVIPTDLEHSQPVAEKAVETATESTVRSPAITAPLIGSRGRQSAVRQQNASGKSTAPKLPTIVSSNVAITVQSPSDESPVTMQSPSDEPLVPVQSPSTTDVAPMESNDESLTTVQPPSDESPVTVQSPSEVSPVTVQSPSDMSPVTVQSATKVSSMEAIGESPVMVPDMESSDESTASAFPFRGRGVRGRARGARGRGRGARGRGRGWRGRSRGDSADSDTDSVRMSRSDCPMSIGEALR